MANIIRIAPEVKLNNTFKVKASKIVTDIEDYRLAGLQTFTYNGGTDLQIDGTEVTADVDSGDNHAHFTYPGAWNESYRVDVAGMRWNNTGLSELYMRMPIDSTNAGVAFVLHVGGVAIYTWNNTGSDGWVLTSGVSNGAGLTQPNVYPAYGQAVRNVGSAQIEFECGVLNGGTWYTTTYTSGFTTACTTLGTFGFGFFQPASADGLFRLPAIVTKLSNSG